MDAMAPSSKRQTRSNAPVIDVISSLPDCVLQHILSFLSTEEAIQTSMLSTRWRYLWTSISVIDLDDTWDYKDIALRVEWGNIFLDFVDRALNHHDDSDIKVLHLNSSVPISYSRLSSWIRVAIRHNVQDIVLLFFGTQLTFPQWLITCPSLVNLSILGSNVLKSQISNVKSTFLDESPLDSWVGCFSNLKRLHLCGISFSDESSTQKFFSGCPILEELSFLSCDWKHVNHVTIDVPTLRSLTFEHVSQSEQVLNCAIKILAANLINFKYSSDLKVDFFFCDNPYIQHACVDLPSGNEVFEEVGPRAIRFISGIRNAQSIRISNGCFRFLIIYALDLPAFDTCTSLEVDSNFTSFDGIVLIHLLKGIPSLQHLQLNRGFNTEERLDGDNLIPSCFNSCLKTVSIYEFRAKPEEMELIGFMLKNATVLERVSICCSGYLSRKRRDEVRNQLSMLPKGSEHCVVELFAFNISSIGFPPN